MASFVGKQSGELVRTSLQRENKEDEHSKPADVKGQTSVLSSISRREESRKFARESFAARSLLACAALPPRPPSQSMWAASSTLPTTAHYARVGGPDVSHKTGYC